MQVDSASGTAIWVHPIDIHLASQVWRIPEHINRQRAYQHA